MTSSFLSSAIGWSFCLYFRLGSGNLLIADHFLFHGYCPFQRAWGEAMSIRIGLYRLLSGKIPAAVGHRRRDIGCFGDRCMIGRLWIFLPGLRRGRLELRTLRTLMIRPVFPSDNLLPQVYRLMYRFMGNSFRCIRDLVSGIFLSRSLG